MTELYTVCHQFNELKCMFLSNVYTQVVLCSTKPLCKTNAVVARAICSIFTGNNWPKKLVLWKRRRLLTRWAKKLVLWKRRRLTRWPKKLALWKRRQLLTRWHWQSISMSPNQPHTETTCFPVEVVAVVVPTIVPIRARPIYWSVDIIGRYKHFTDVSFSVKVPPIKHR